jgi:hypothetical protein
MWIGLQRAELYFQTWKIMLNDLPDNLQVQAKILMHDAISHFRRLGAREFEHWTV